MTVSRQIFAWAAQKFSRLAHTATNKDEWRAPPTSPVDGRTLAPGNRFLVWLIVALASFQTALQALVSLAERKPHLSMIWFAGAITIFAGAALLENIKSFRSP